MIKVNKITDVNLLRKSCESTMIIGTSNISLDKAYQSMHSIIRTQLFWIEMTNIPTFVSVHIVRHNIGVNHFVMTNRDDRGSLDGKDIHRLTPVKHSMLINAEALINMSRKRLCNQSHKETRDIMNYIKSEVKKVDLDLAKYMIPECEFRNNYCPELKPCGKIKEKNYEK